MKEVWKKIDGFEKLYKISNLGNIYSFYSNRVLRNELKNGYFVVTLSKDKKFRKYFVHRLIAKAFIPNPENKPFINHKNGIRNDNRIKNLEWCTNGENLKHAYRTGIAKAKLGLNQGIKNGNAKTTEQHVLEIREKYSTGKYTQKKLSEEYGINQSSIGKIIQRTRWTHIL